MKLKRNKKQLLFLYTILNNKADYVKEGKGGWQRGFTATFQAGRASGKTFVLFDLLALCARELPGAIFGLVAKNYYQVQAVILQQLEKVLKQHGITLYNKVTNPYGQFVIFQKPPDHWKRPYNSITDYTRTISFCNGFALQLASADSAESQRGINWDGIFSDESASYDEKFKQKLYPGIRENIYRFRDKRKGRTHLKHPLHWLKCEFTSAPTSPIGNHIYRVEENYKKDPEGYYWLQATAYDNLQFLPGDFINELRNSLRPLAFAIEVMNERLSKVSNAFYPALDLTRNGFEEYEYVWNPDTGIYDRTDLSASANKELILGVDFNGKFTSALVAQQHKSEFRFIDELWVKESTSTLVDSLMDEFLERYKNHKKKIIRIRGDQSGKIKGENAKEASWTIIKRRLTEAGWKYIDEVQKVYPPYEHRYYIAAIALEHKNEKLDPVKIHTVKCKNLIISLQLTPAQGPTFEKDKSSEKNIMIDQEHATHLSDIFDYILFPTFSRFVVRSRERTSGYKVSA